MQDDERRTEWIDGCLAEVSVADRCLVSPGLEVYLGVCGCTSCSMHGKQHASAPHLGWPAVMMGAGTQVTYIQA